MVGNLNIKRYLGCLVVILLISCKNENTVGTYKTIIEDNFLGIVDTMAYRYGSFRPLPPVLGAEERFNNHSLILISINGKIVYDVYNERYIKDFLKQNTTFKNEFENLNNDQQYAVFSIEKKFPRKIGKYLLSFNLNKIDTTHQYGGHLEIKNFKFSDDLGFLLIEKSEGKSMICFIVLFKKINNEWKIIKREVLYES